jgi:hypothetical protein
MTVRIGRLILVSALGLMTVLSTAPVATARPAPAQAHAAHDCCKGKPHSSQPAPGPERCHGGMCGMACCRIVGTTGDARPVLTRSTPLVEHAVVLPATLHSLSEPQAIFHPPRA